MNRCVIVHGWEGYPKEGWFPWLKRELETSGWQVTVPAMPNSANPKMVKWVAHLTQTIGTADEQTYLVGHSLGCITILRYLEQLPKGQTIGGAVLVAGFAERLKYDELQNFFSTPLNWRKIKGSCSKFNAIFSDNDPYVPLSNAELFRHQLGAEVMVLKSRGHFSGPGDNCTKLPEALTAIFNLVNRNV